MTSAERLEGEIRHLRATIVSGIDNRKHHPSYGYRKSDVLANYHRLVGMLAAWALVTGRSESNAGVVGVTRGSMADIREFFDIDIDMLWARISSC